MAASPLPADAGNAPQREKWDRADSSADAPSDIKPEVRAGDDHPAAPPPADGAEYVRTTSPAVDASVAASDKADSAYRGEKQVKPNKVYIGGLPEHTRKEDLESCFGKIGNIVNVELKVGYGFVEFDNREAAEESVAKYHEGYFMGNKIRVELSRGGGRTAKYSNDPGACFKCGLMGHWARECPNHPSTGSSTTSRRPSDAPLIDRIQPPKDYPPPPRDFPPYRDDYARYPPPRDVRYGFDYPPPPIGRDYRRPPSPPRDFRDYPPPPVRSARDFDDYRMRGPPPLPPPPPPRYESRPGYYPDADPPGYPPRGYPPPPRDYYDRYDARRSGPPPERYGALPPPAAVRPRTPPSGPPPPSRARDDFDRPPARDYPPGFHSRPSSPPPSSRYADYPPRAGSSEAPTRYRRRSQSPPPRAGSSGYDAANYPPSSGNPPYTGGSSGSFAGNGYSGGVPRSSAGRDYVPRARDAGEPASSYRRP
ncbi:hypothetical protein B0H21DRAFT_744623 [Amylocystis lapponica]|nr:hypothetical protein B0H21DRAFT_744623 [Amylocystis lapponica]